MKWLVGRAWVLYNLIGDLRLPRMMLASDVTHSDLAAPMKHRLAAENQYSNAELTCEVHGDWSKRKETVPSPDAIGIVCHPIPEHK